MPAWPSSLRARLTLWYTIVLGVPLIAFALVSYVTFTRALRVRTDDFIGDALTAFARELVAERRAASSAERAIVTTVNEVRFRDLQITILGPDRAVMAKTSVREADGGTDQGGSVDVSDLVATALASHDLAAPLAVSATGPPGTYRILSRPVELDGQRYELTGAYAMRDIDAMRERIRHMFLIAIPLLLLSAATGASFLAKRGLAPLSAMAARAATISAPNLHERLPVTGGEEMVGLARVVNDLLNRLDHAFEQQRRFVADASHELRTPTAILRTEADVTLARPHRTEEEYRASLGIVQDAAGRLGHVVEDLFLLARADAGHLVMRREPLYLEEVLHESTRALGSVGSRQGVDVRLGQVVDVPMRGDADLLGRLLLNLIDNAIKHSPSGGLVEVELSRSGPWGVVTVTDAGEGIPPEAQSRVFEPFFRADQARPTREDRSTSGAGLGLAIARRIAEMHAGQLELAESRPGRTVFRLTLPIDDGQRALSPST